MPDIVPDPNLKISKFNDIKIKMPKIRRVFPQLIASEICGVQPMSGPVGLAFALKYKYGDKEEIIPILIFECGEDVDPWKVNRSDLVLKKHADGNYWVIKSKFDIFKQDQIITEQQLKNYMSEHFEDII